VCSSTDIVQVQVWDEDLVDADDPMGSLRFQVSTLQPQAQRYLLDLGARNDPGAAPLDRLAQDGQPALTIRCVAWARADGR
jgi:hypothetical protein